MTEQLSKTTAREINETIRYTSWTVLRRTQPLESPRKAVEEFLGVLKQANDKDVQLRGIYDVSGFRANADIMLWFHAPSAGLIQETLREIRRTALGRATETSWAAMALHRPAEFNKGHVPAFMAGEKPKDWISVYPFVRSYDWYILPEEERRDMLVEHGMAARGYKDLLSNTVAAFALGDYEWILALESNDLHDLVDMMRDLRATKARLHVREEVPFHTGRMIEPAAIEELLA
jgi:peroxiredoxin